MLAGTIGAAALLASAACGGGGGDGGEPPELPELEGGLELEEQESGGSGDPAGAGETGEAGGFDECGLLSPEELAQMIGVERLLVSSRSAMPQSEGGRLASCGYNTEDKPGLSQVALSTVAGTNAEQFFRPFAEREVQEVPHLGDQAQIVAYEAPEVGVHFRELRVLDGQNGFHFWYTYYPSSGGLPALSEDAMAQLMSDVAHTALERMPETVSIGDGTPEGRCADVDLGQAAQVLGQELTTARTVESDSGALHCSFAGIEANLSVTVVTDPEQVRGLAPPPELVNEPDIGDGALVQIVPSEGGVAVEVPLDATISVGDQVMLVRATHGPEVGGVAAPRPQDTQLVRDIVAAFGH